jgi:16S rRNA (cytidine1402-2'-O)-methyltransferase
MQSSAHVLLQPTDFAPGLYIVATPIGNLRDITLRALDVLSGADMILAEDTRQTQKLLGAYDIKSSLTAYHDHNAAKKIPFVMEALEAGKVVAQVSDAGTPLVSDPGFKLVRAAIAAGHDVFPLPGASALLAGLSVAGLPTDKFLFAGFLPNKSTARKRALVDLKSIAASLVFFESPARIADSLADMRDMLGDRQAALARELTKRYEQTRRGSLSDLIESCTEEAPRGEIVIIVGPPSGAERWSEAEIDGALLEHIPDMRTKGAAAHVAEMSGWAKRDVYQRALRLS